MKNEILKPTCYEIYSQDLSKKYLELQFLGYVRDIESAKTMCKCFREIFTQNNKPMTVFFRHIEVKDGNK